MSMVRFRHNLRPAEALTERSIELELWRFEVSLRIRSRVGPSRWKWSLNVAQVESKGWLQRQEADPRRNPNRVKL